MDECLGLLAIAQSLIVLSVKLCGSGLCAYAEIG